MSKKKGYFFVLDAMLALMVLVIGIFLVTSSYVNVPEPAQVSLLSDDLLDFLSDTRIGDLNNPYAGIGGYLWNHGEITDSDNSLLQQIGEFYSVGRLDTAERFIQNVSSGAVPQQYMYEIWMDKTRLYPKIPSSGHSASRNGTGLLLTSKKLTFGILNRTTSDIWGPYRAEVFVWER